MFGAMNMFFVEMLVFYSIMALLVYVGKDLLHRTPDRW